MDLQREIELLVMSRVKNCLSGMVSMNKCLIVAFAVVLISCENKKKLSEFSIETRRSVKMAESYLFEVAESSGKMPDYQTFMSFCLSAGLVSGNFNVIDFGVDESGGLAIIFMSVDDYYTYSVDSELVRIGWNVKKAYSEEYDSSRQEAASPPQPQHPQ